MPEAEWNDERTRIICELFVEQVQAGNRPNTHLNNVGYRTVASKFHQRTQLLYTKMQLKNKWDKFKSDYITWKKLLVVGAAEGLPWDSAKGTFVADDDWWKKINKELPGVRRYRNGGMQNEDKLKVMFDYLDINGVDPSPVTTDGMRSGQDNTSNGVDPSPGATGGMPSAQDNPRNTVDHSPLAADGHPFAQESPLNGVDYSPLGADGSPSAPESPMPGMDDSPQTTADMPSVIYSTANGTNLRRSDNSTEQNGMTPPVHESAFPSNRTKRPSHVNVTKKNKRTKSETALLMQTHLDRIVELAKKAQATFEKFTARPSASIQDVMALVRECGARCGSNEHFIATELFVNQEQREMFLTLETPEERFQWLRRKYISKYLSSPNMSIR